MYGDTDVLRRRVAQLREQSQDVRALADQLAARTEGLRWTGRAAEAMHERVRERAGQLRAAGGQHDTAAQSLERHLLEVGRLQDLIADTERRAGALLAEARIRVARASAAAQDATDADVRLGADPDDLTLAGFTPPPPGHRDWLTVELPGLSGPRAS